MEAILEEISQAFQQHKKVIGGRGPHLLDIVNSVLNRPVRPSLGEDGKDYGS